AASSTSSWRRLCSSRCSLSSGLARAHGRSTPCFGPGSHGGARNVPRRPRTQVRMTDTQGLSCAELVELISDYVDGALPPHDRARVDEHLALCRGCRLYVDQLRATIELTGRLRCEDVPVETATALLAAFRDWKTGPR